MAETRLRTRQKVVEFSTEKRDQLQPIMEALDALSSGDQQLQEAMRAALAELRQWVATTATPPAPAPAAASAMDTDFDDVQRKRKDTLDGLTEEGQAYAEEKLLLREACKKTKLG